MATAPQLPSGERIYAIGDVHGRADLLERLLDTIRRDNAARSPSSVGIVLVGDLIDRGPASAELVAACRELTRHHGAFIVLKGNHEATMVDALRGSVPAFAFWLDHGGDAALESWGVPAALVAAGPSRELMHAARAKVPREAIEWLDALPLHHRSGNCLFVHAGIRPGVRLAKQKATDLLWIRGDFTQNEDALPYVVVHGHTVDEAGPRLYHGRLGIDTGAYSTGRLSAVGIEGGRYWSLSTASPSVALGSLPTIEESVRAILGDGGERAPSTPHRAVRGRLLATASAAAALLIVVGTFALIRERDRGPAPVTRSIAVASLPRPAVGDRDDVASGVPASTVPSAVATQVVPAASGRVGAGRGDAAFRIGRASYGRTVTAAIPAPIGRDGDRAISTASTVTVADVPVSRPAVDPGANPVAVASVAPVPAADVPPVVIAGAPRPSDRTPAANGSTPPVASAPSPPSPQAARERVQAIDAIRLLRRQ